jgi:hypothetical protein
MSLKQFEYNVRSQFGEDGVIEEIFKRIGVENRICVEFGAWDGIHFSNTWNLWNEKGWQSLQIEGDVEKYKILLENIREKKNVQSLNAYVSFEGKDSLDRIFDNFKFPKHIDLLSIDIDGDDYYIFESLTNYTPRVILVEYNPTIPAGVDLVQSKGEYFGASAQALLELAHKKQYKLAHMTDTNLFFVAENVFDRLGFSEPSIDEIFNRNHLVYVISSYDGKAFTVGKSPYAVFTRMKSNDKYPNIINAKGVNIQKSIIYNL